MNKIKECRKKKKLTLQQLSEELAKNNFKISADALGKYEREEREPKLSTWEKLADYFNVSVSYITGVSDKTYKDTGRLQSIRKAKGLSYQQVADAYNKEADTFSVFDHVEKHITAQTIENIENGNYQPTKREWQLLSYALNVPQFYLAGHSNDKTGWQEWAEATGYSVEQLQNEVKRLIDTGRLESNSDKQHQIGYAVQSLDCQVPTTTSGVINGVQSQLNDALRYINDAFLVSKYTPVSPGSSMEVIKPGDTHIRKDMDRKAYEQMIDTINEARIKLSHIHIQR